MTSHKTPPSPKGHWLLGNFPEFRRDILGFFEQSIREYGDVVRFRLPNMPAYLIAHPDDIEYVLVTANRNFKKHKLWRQLTGVFGNGLLTSEGDFWIRQRRLAQPAFHRNQIANYGKIMVEFTERMLEKWHDGEITDVHEEMMTLTMQIVAKTLFNADVSKDAKDVGNAMDIVMHEFQARFGRPFVIPDFIPTAGNLRFRQAIKRFDKTVYEIIRARRS
ncbi:MAG TPA: cytochrome P450, partial [Acidobacteriota bacterium]